MRRDDLGALSVIFRSYCARYDFLEFGAANPNHAVSKNCSATSTLSSTVSVQPESGRENR